jgi:hypothetical protein
MAHAVAGETVFPVKSAVIRTGYEKGLGAAAQSVQQCGQLRIDIMQRGRMRVDVIAFRVRQVVAVRLMNGADINEEKDPLTGRKRLQTLAGQFKLKSGRVRIRHAEFRRPVTFIEETRQDAAERRVLVKEANATNADRVIAAGAKTRDHIGGVEDARLRSGGFTAGKARGKQPWWPGRRFRRRQKSGEKRVVCRVGKTAGRVPLLPTCGEKLREMRGLTITEAGLGDIKP